MKRKILAALLAVGLMVAQTTPAHALFGFNVVFDPKNYAQNVMTAVRSLTMIKNQVSALSRQAKMLINQAKHLQRLDYTSASELRLTLNRINQLMAQADGLAFQLGAVEETYARLYPETFSAAVTGDELVRDARDRWQLSRQSFRHAMLVQAEIAQSVESDQDTLDRLMAESQAAPGSLKAQQAGNQLLALNTKQAMQAQQLWVTQARADALEQARRAMAEEEARVRFTQFIADGNAYTPID